MATQMGGALGPAGAGAPAQQQQPFAFAAKNTRVSWDAVRGFEGTVARLVSGMRVGADDLNALDEMARGLEEARIEPEPGMSPEESMQLLAGLATILQLSSEYQATRAEDLQAANAKKDQELDLLDEQLEALERRGGTSDVRLEQEAEAARVAAESLERRIADQREELDVLKEQLDRTKREVRDEKRRSDDAVKAAKSAEDDLRELQEQLSAERQRNSAKQKDDSTTATRMAMRNQEVARYQKENRLVAEENERLSARVEDIMAECVQYSESIVKLDDAAQAWRGREADVEAAADGLRRERDKLAAQLETTRVDLEERTGLLQDFETKFTAEYQRWEKEKEELQRDAKRLRASTAVEGVRGSLHGGGFGGGSPRRQLAIRDVGRDPNRPPPDPDDPRYVEELEAEVAELRDLRVLLLEAYDQLEQDVGREVDIALRRQQRNTATLEAKVSSQDEALTQEGKRFKAMDRGLTDAQEDLAEARGRMAQYEAGVYGLSEAMRDLKLLRLQVRAADQNVEDAVATSNGLGRQVEDLTEETRFLRQQAGIPEDADIDLGGFKLKSKVEAAQLRALNGQLEREVGELEEDRRRLRNELRYRAKWQGEHAARLGLSARQLAMLEEYADALRFGKDDIFTSGAAGDDIDDNINANTGCGVAAGIGARAVQELEHANKQLQERLAEAFDRIQRGGGGSLALGGGGGGGGLDGAAAAQVMELQSQLARARLEIVRLEDSYHEVMMRSSLQGSFPRAESGVDSGVHHGESVSPTHPDAAAAAATAAELGPVQLETTVARLRGERNALHVRLQQLQAAAPSAPGTPAPLGDYAATAAGSSAVQAAAAEAQRMREECHAADRAVATLVVDLQSKEDHLEQLAADVVKYRQGMAELGATRAALYREHVRTKVAWEEERRTLLDRAKRAETEADANRAEAKDAQLLAERLKPGAESGLKEALSAAHSRLAVLQVREVRLTRALEGATAAETLCRADKEELEADAREMSRAAQERLAFHERRAAEAELRAARCQRELDLCVPRVEHAAVVDVNRALQVRFKELLSTRVEAVVTASQLAAAMEDALTARAEAEASAAAAAAATVRARELSGALDDTATAAGREGLGVSGAVELRREVAETRAELDAAKRAAELTTREARRWEETRGDLEATVGGLERQLADAKGTLHRSQEAERKHLQQLAGAVSEEKHRAEMEIAAAAEDEVARLRAEVIRAEDRAASAETELSRKTAGTATRDAELTQLRAAVRDMERRSDAQAALGRANQEVVRLKGGGAQLKHQVQVAEAEADRLHGDCLRLHRRLQAQEGRLFGLREDARGLMQAQEAALARMEAALAGRVDPAQAEKWERALSDLRRGAVRREALLQSAQKTLRGAVERADAAEGELTALRRLERLANALDADVTLREVRSQGEELLQAKLTAARADRAENAATERAAYLESREGEREQHLCKVEEAAMRDKQVGDTRADDLQRRVRALQRELLEVRHQAGDTGGATAGATAGAGLDSLAIVNSGGGGESFTARGSSSADVPVPLPRRRANAEALAAVGAAAAVGAGAASLETQRLVLQQIEAIRALKLRAAEAERRAAEVGAEVRAAQDAAVNAEADRDALQRRLDTQLALAGIGSSGGGGAGGDGEESAVAQVTAVAQATIARLQELVAEKNAALTRAQAAMAELRSSALGKQNEDRRTIEQLNDLLFKQDQAEIKGMREALESSGGGGGRDGRDDGDGGGGRFGSKSHDQLVSLLAEREQAVEVLTSRFEQQRTRHDGAEARLQERP